MLCCAVSSLADILLVSLEFDAACCCPPAQQPVAKTLQLRCLDLPLFPSHHLSSNSQLHLTTSRAKVPGIQKTNLDDRLKKNCWNIDLSADLAEVIPITVWPKCQHCTQPNTISTREMIYMTNSITNKSVFSFRQRDTACSCGRCSATTASSAIPIDRYLLSTGHTAAAVNRWGRLTDRQTDTVLLHRPAAYYVNSVNNTMSTVHHKNCAYDLCLLKKYKMTQTKTDQLH